MFFMKFLDLRFFDGETIPGDGTSVPQTEQETGLPEETELSSEVQDFSEFDRPSPLLRNGAVDEPESVPAAERDRRRGQPPAQPVVATEQEPAARGADTENQQPQTQQPYRTLKYHGQDVPVASEDELMRLASQGLDYTQKTQRIAHYRGLIEKLEANPMLMSQVVGLVQGRTVVPPVRPQPQQAPSTRQVAEKEPEWQDGESYEEYTARLEAWKKGPGAQQQSEEGQPTGNDVFMAKVNEALELRQKQEQSVAVARATVADPHHLDVLGVVPNLPLGIQMAMNSDPVSYQMIYDQLRVNLFGESYFARPRGGAQPQLPQGQPAPQPAAAQAQPANPPQAVQIKAAAKPAPYVEPSRGQNAPQARRSAEGLPDDIWSMSDKDFDSFVDSVYVRR